LQPPRHLLLPYTTLFRSVAQHGALVAAGLQFQARALRGHPGFLFSKRNAVAPRVAGADHHAMLELDDVEAAPQWTHLDFMTERLDRKSTRLNSSHVKISY